MMLALIILELLTLRLPLLLLSLLYCKFDSWANILNGLRSAIPFLSRNLEYERTLFFDDYKLLWPDLKGTLRLERLMLF
jgi:hypothetical protein